MNLIGIMKLIKNFLLQARNAGNKETIRRGALMKMLMNTAQTMPLYIGKTSGAKPPPLCGAIPAEPTYIAKVQTFILKLIFVHGKMNFHK